VADLGDGLVIVSVVFSAFIVGALVWLFAPTIGDHMGTGGDFIAAVARVFLAAWLVFIVFVLPVLILVRIY